MRYPVTGMDALFATSPGTRHHVPKKNVPPTREITLALTNKTTIRMGSVMSVLDKYYLRKVAARFIPFRIVPQRDSRPRKDRRHAKSLMIH